MKRVTFRELGSDRRWSRRMAPHRAALPEGLDQLKGDELFAYRALQKIWGKRAWFHQDSGLRHGLFGQVTRWSDEINAHRCLTGTVEITVEED